LAIQFIGTKETCVSQMHINHSNLIDLMGYYF